MFSDPRDPRRHRRGLATAVNCQCGRQIYTIPAGRRLLVPSFMAGQQQVSTQVIQCECGTKTRIQTVSE